MFQLSTSGDYYALEEELRQEKAKKRTLALIGIGGAAFLVIVIAVICRKKNRGE